MRCGPAPGTPEARDWSASTARFARCSVPPGSSPMVPFLPGPACWRARTSVPVCDSTTSDSTGRRRWASGTPSPRTRQRIEARGPAGRVGAGCQSRPRARRSHPPSLPHDPRRRGVTPTRLSPTWPRPPTGPVASATCGCGELLDRYLTWLDDGSGAAPIESHRRIADTVIEPAFGRQFAALLDTADIDGLLRAAHQDGASRQELTEILALLAQTYRWARARRWTTRNPTTDIRIRDIVG